MPPPLIRAMAIVKYAAAKTNLDLKLIDKRRAEAILKARLDEIIDGGMHRRISACGLANGLWHADHHMNLYEAIANRV